ncbi:hypothetical protein PAXRUDRAFT_504723 [Paxillus rubicundulus Ve08.2h10]|uniref:Uncharacterized protein n=1 Tax=Paxillus rubicundulus Ve08.2h10 TaxID=930991 RepID=A0A0D0E9L1_9AGAM|nr:hypothetical protein PAXRUDRAFT_504723 [Paxillus rubicundulus Ve08.2h10]
MVCRPGWFHNRGHRVPGSWGCLNMGATQAPDFLPKAQACGRRPWMLQYEARYMPVRTMVIERICRKRTSRIGSRLGVPVIEVRDLGSGGQGINV